MEAYAKKGINIKRLIPYKIKLNLNNYLLRT